MTMPEERTRALRWAGEFLHSIKTMEGISPEVKHDAEVILRHYPSSHDIEFHARVSYPDPIMGKWLAPERDPNK